MKRTGLIIGFVLVVLIAAAPIFAQAPGTQPRPQAPVTTVPVSKVAVIFSEAFQDPKAGITRFTVLLKVTQQKIAQLDQLKKDYQRKGEDAQAAYQKRRAEVLAPLQDDVGKALDAYARSHAITMIIDGSQVQGIVYASETIDITRAFISDYNSKNPVTASVTPPK